MTVVMALSQFILGCLWIVFVNVCFITQHIDFLKLINLSLI